jgi:hypothetical protein
MSGKLISAVVLVVSFVSLAHAGPLNQSISGWGQPSSPTSCTIQPNGLLKIPFDSSCNYLYVDLGPRVENGGPVTASIDFSFQW